jgi:hypothetical protein
METPFVREARKFSEVTITFRPMDLSKCVIAAVSDASFATMHQSKSQTGYFVLMGDVDFHEGRMGLVNLLMWKSARQRRVARSTFGAECLALGDAVDAADFAKSLLAEVLQLRDLKNCLEGPPGVHWLTDCRDLYDALTRDTVPSCAERRLALDIVIMRELLSRPLQWCHWVDTHHQLADGLTKALQNHHIREVLKTGRYAWQYSDDCRSAKVRKAAPKFTEPVSVPARTSVVHHASRVRRVRFSLKPQVYRY